MGGGNWDTGVYTSRATAKAAAGQTTFHHTYQVRTGQAKGVNPLVDPLIRAGTASPHAGQVMREVMISDEHPNPTAIAVVLDVTGSNIQAATVAHSKLPQLHGLLQRKGYAEDPQILFGAIGDAFSDEVPLQMGQFESDNRMDEQLEAIYLEGNGGGQRHETYELAAYFLAHHTYMEPFERYGKKGYVFFIGDEMPYQTVQRAYNGYYRGRGHTLESLTGDVLEGDIPTERVFEELKAKFEVFFLFQKQGSYQAQDILPTWRKLLGERAVVLDDPAAVCEFIAGLLGMNEAGLTEEEVTEDLLAIGADPAAVKAAGKALARIGGGSSPLARTTGTLPEDDQTSGTARL